MEVREPGYKPIGLADAIENELEERPERACRVIGMLIELLHDKRLLSDEEAMRFVPEHYEIYKYPE